ncbi:hypothetical protein EVAR_49748_1 [Eumeta japonica]|uniref:Uncharacterized protein n=1 Tax=Eumeta variegata TaxID=151549 RepID=A0A4C1YCG4_EUMVA|nr:hypothetical protein EVAR_49748_1 [Eumeta japonica]
MSSHDGRALNRYQKITAVSTVRLPIEDRFSGTGRRVSRNGLSRSISEAVRDYRGANWEATIDRAGESAKNLNHLCRQLTRAAAPKCPITDRSGVRRYDAKTRVEVIAEHLAEQFTPNPPATSPNLQEHHAQVRYRVEEFMATAPPPLPETCSSPQPHYTRLSYASPKRRLRDRTACPRPR